MPVRKKRSVINRNISTNSSRGRKKKRPGNKAKKRKQSSIFDPLLEAFEETNSAKKKSSKGSFSLAEAGKLLALGEFDVNKIEEYIEKFRGNVESFRKFAHEAEETIDTMLGIADRMGYQPKAGSWIHKRMRQLRMSEAYGHGPNERLRRLRERPAAPAPTPAVQTENPKQQVVEEGGSSDDDGNLLGMLGGLLGGGGSGGGGSKKSGMSLGTVLELAKNPFVRKMVFSGLSKLIK